MSPRSFLTCGLLLLSVIATGCGREKEDAAIAAVGGNPARGRATLVSYGCIACHTIPGVSGANGLVGPPLTKMGARAYVGGGLQNTPENMIHWIENPPAIDAKTAMPNLQVNEPDARDIATYLFTLR